MPIIPVVKSVFTASSLYDPMVKIVGVSITGLNAYRAQSIFESLVKCYDRSF